MQNSFKILVLLLVVWTQVPFLSCVCKEVVASPLKVEQEVAADPHSCCSRSDPSTENQTFENSPQFKNLWHCCGSCSNVKEASAYSMNYSAASSWETVLSAPQLQSLFRFQMELPGFCAQRNRPPPLIALSGDRLLKRVWQI
jgi:hypothetical protein